MVKPGTYVSLLEDLLLPQFKTEEDKLNTIDGWLHDKPEEIITRRGRDREIRYLKDISKTPWARLIINTAAQLLNAEGIYSASRPDEALEEMWSPWQRNAMATKQGALYRAAYSYGLAYTLILPGTDAFGKPGAQITALSPREFFAVYNDIVEDDFPSSAVRIIKQPKGAVHYRIYDESGIHYMSRESSDAKVQYIDTVEHSMGFTPVVRYANEMDLEGRTPGEIEPLIPLFGRINKTDYDRMLTQHFNSWKIRTATGIEKPETQAEADQEKMRLRHDDMLTGEAGVQFGTLDETQLSPFIQAHDSDLESLAALSQTPMTTFGKLVNVSAEGLVEARNSLRAKNGDRQTIWGEAHTQTLRCAAIAENRIDDAYDFTIKMRWADDDSNLLSAAVDALGKAAQMLGVPPEKLWDRIPGVDTATAQSWFKYAQENPSAEVIQARAVADALASSRVEDAAAQA